MTWFCTMLMSGMIVSIGWRLGAVIFDYIRSIIIDAPEGIRKIRRYQKRKRQQKQNRQNKQIGLTYSIEQRRP